MYMIYLFVNKKSLCNISLFDLGKYVHTLPLLLMHYAIFYYVDKITKYYKYCISIID